MTRAYSLSDTAPRDAGNQKFMAWPDIASSPADFALPAGIGASTIGITSKIHAALQVGTHVGGSAINNAPVGVLLLGMYSTNASPMSIGNAMPVRADPTGAMWTTGPSTTASAMSGSTETFTVASGYLYRAIIAGCGVVSAGQVALMNGTTSIAHMVFRDANETLPIIDFGHGATCFGSLRYERRNTAGTVYVTALYRNNAQP